MVVAAATTVAPLWAMAENQEVAEQIAASLQESGQLQGFKIGVRYEEGTAWLSGRVSSQEELDAALQLASETEGVTRVVNNLSVGASAEDTTPLRHIANALGAEQVGRPITTDLTVASASLPGERLRHMARADRLPAEFATGPASHASASVKRPYEIAKTSRTRTTTKQPSSTRTAQRQTVAVPTAYMQQPVPTMGQPIPQYMSPVGGGVAPAQYDQPYLPNYSWPSYAAYPNYAALTYPKQYSPTAWPYIGPFYPYPQVPLGWRKVVLEWHDGWWHLDFDDGSCKEGYLSGLFRFPWKH
jgi:hypothetical protein